MITFQPTSISASKPGRWTSLSPPSMECMDGMDGRTRWRHQQSSLVAVLCLARGRDSTSVVAVWSPGKHAAGMGWGTDVYKLRPSSKLGPDNRHINQGAMDRSWVSFNFLMSQIQWRQLVPLDDQILPGWLAYPPVHAMEKLPLIIFHGKPVDFPWAFSMAFSMFTGGYL